MEKDFVPYELALELKQLGFDEYCMGACYYEWKDRGTTQILLHTPDEYDSHDGVKAPLFQQAFRWFRDVHNLKGGIEYVGGLTPETTWWDIYVVGHFNTNYKEMSMKYQPYEEAESACLQKLIEIVKTK